MKRSTVDILWLTLIVAIGAMIRLDFLLASNFVIDADEGIVGLMAKHILEGRGIPVFYYGQHYMGSLEAICVSVLFQFFGIGDTTLKAVPLLFALLLIVLMFFLGRRIGGRYCGFGAAILTAVPPSALIVWSTMARGGFIEVIVIGAAALLAGFGWFQDPQRPVWRISLAAFLLGVGWWVNNQIIYFFLPIGILGVLAARERWTILFQSIAAVLAFFMGSLPFWVYNIEHHGASFGMFGRAPLKEILEHLLGVFTVALPIILGVKQFWHDDPAYSSFDILVMVLFFGLLVIFVTARWKELVSLVWLQKRRSTPVEILFLMLVATIGIFSASSFGWLVQAPRYLLPLYVPWFLIIAWTCQQFEREKKGVGILILGFCLIANLLSSYYPARAIPGQPYVFASERVAPDHTQLIQWLDQRNIHWVRTNYWIGYRLAFETKERVRFIVTQEPFQIRIPEWSTESENVPEKQIPYVLSPTQARLIRKALTILNFTFEETVQSGYTVLYNVSPPSKDLRPLPHESFSLASPLNKDLLPYATDDNEETRWGSGTAQKPGFFVDVMLTPGTPVKALQYDLSHWFFDYPRGLSITYEDTAGNWTRLFGPEDWAPIRYLFENRSSLTFYFPGIPLQRIRLEQTSSDGIFDWSIAEIRVFD